MTDRIISRREDGSGTSSSTTRKSATPCRSTCGRRSSGCSRSSRPTTSARRGAVGRRGQAFVSGADISKFEDERSSAEAVARYDATTARIYEKLNAFPKPTIAQITGSCVGGAWRSRYAAICASAATAPLRHPGGEARPRLRLRRLQRLVNLIGPAFAKEMFFTARLFSAAEAYEMGLVNRVVPDDQVSYVADYAGPSPATRRSPSIR